MALDLSHEYAEALRVELESAELLIGNLRGEVAEVRRVLQEQKRP